MGEWLKWLWLSDAGLALRVSLGVAFFVGLALWDIRRHGRSAQRWREYVFLLAAVGVAMVYGIVNDQITSAISWEYFYYAKDGRAALGEQTPPDRAAMCWEAAKVGMKATWTAGLIFGVAALLANNPRPGLPRLSYRRLYRLIPLAVGAAALCGAMAGTAAYFGAFTHWFTEIIGQDLWRPRRFMTAWGIHLGGYIGGFLGTAGAVWRILRRRSALKRAATSEAGSPAAKAAAAGRPSATPARRVRADPPRNR